VSTALASFRLLTTNLRLRLLTRLRSQRPTLSWTVRLTASTTLAFIATRWLYPESDPLLAALTALLVTQVTQVSAVRHGLDRVLSVLAGVALALGFSVSIGMTWWGLGLLVAASLIVGMLLRLGPNLLEVPISAMLVLGVGAAKTGPAAFERIIETLIGAGVGMAINILIPPGVRVANAGAAIERFANEIAQTLDDAAVEVVEDASPERASAWLARARNFSNITPVLDGALRHAEESRRLNVRAIASPDIGHSLRSGLDAMEHTSVAIRSLFRSVNDVVHFSESDDETGEVYPLSARAMASEVMTSIALTIREFGKLVHAQIDAPGNANTSALEDSLYALEQARIRAREQFRLDPVDSPFVHELNVFLVATAGRTQRELDPKFHNWLFTPVTPVRPRAALVPQWRRKAS
jgi:hypothetical protein